jgi:hypothetical protein
MIGLYQVCHNNPLQAGDMTAYTQQFTALKKQGRPEPHKVRQHCAEDLLQFVKTCQKANELIIVAGDFNEVLGLRDSGLTRLCTRRKLVDVVLHNHQETDFRTYTRGQKVLDYMLVDPDLLPGVEACGYEPFNIRIMSDHRGVYIDVNWDFLLGAQMTKTVPLELRDISSGKPHQMLPYWKAADKHFEDHKFYQQMEELKDCFDRRVPNHQLAEKLDKRHIAGRIYAGSKVKRYPSCPYSPEIVKLRNRKCLLNLIKMNYTGDVDYQDQIAMWEQKLRDLDYEPPANLAEAKAQQRQAHKDLQEALKEEMKTRKLRRQHLQQRGFEYESAGDKEKVKIIRRILLAEQTKRTWKKTREARGLTHSGGIDRVDIPADPNYQGSYKECTEWKTEYDPDKVHSLIMAELQRHFSAAKDGTWTSPPLDTTMEFTGVSEMADAILDGTFITPEEVPQVVKFLIEHLKARSEEAVDPIIADEQMEGKIKSWDERTSSSPLTNFHLGHGKAYYARHDLDPKSPDAIWLEATRSKVAQCHLTSVELLPEIWLRLFQVGTHCQCHFGKRSRKTTDPSIENHPPL